MNRRVKFVFDSAIACLLNRIRKPNMIVGIDGSTYKYHPLYDLWVKEKIKELIDPSLKVTYSLKSANFPKYFNRKFCMNRSVSL